MRRFLHDPLLTFAALTRAAAMQRLLSFAAVAAIRGLGHPKARGRAEVAPKRLQEIVAQEPL